MNAPLSLIFIKVFNMEIKKNVKMGSIMVCIYIYIYIWKKIIKQKN